MKRILVAAVAVLVTLAGFNVPAQVAARAPLSNFDRRTDQAAGRVQTVAVEHQPAVAALQARVPQLEVTRSPVLGTPDFFAARGGFLTGPDGAGLGVAQATAQRIPKADRHRALKAFMNEHAALLGYGSSALDGARISREHVGPNNGVRTTVWQQELNGLPVFEGITMGHITARGELVNLYTHFVPDANGAAARGLRGVAVAAAPASTRLSAAEAIVIGAQSIGDVIAPDALTSQGVAEGVTRRETFRAVGALKGEQYASLVWLPLNGNTLRLCWQVTLSSRTRGEMFTFLVDADSGEVIVRRCLTDYISPATYNVYTSDSPSPFSPGYNVPGNPAQPAVVPRTLVTLPALNTNASPNGWIDDLVNETLGNNVDAHTDLNDDDAPDLPRPQGTPNRTFNFPLDLTQAPLTYSSASVVNLFYWNNFMHDKLWELGFTEAAGNFQNNNFGRGGVGGDSVQADAQDGASLNDGFHANNANMATPPDGIAPRMQMYLFTGPTPDRDGDLDAEVMCHEYTHGLSNRRVGGGVLISALQPRGMGEGWSDFYGLSLLSETNDAVGGVYPFGGYVTLNFAGINLTDNYYFGIRHYPYSTNLLKNPLTFKDIDPNQISPHAGIPLSPLNSPFRASDAAEVHHQGEVWCAILWEVRANLIAKYGPAAGNQITLQLVTDAMALCPPNPNFIQSRDAILLADLANNNNANYNELWRAFAKRGLGASASSPGSATTIGVVEAYDFPGLLIISVAANDGATGNGNGAIDFNECIEVSIAVRNGSVATATNISGVLTSATPGVVIVQATAAYPNLAPGATAQNLTPFRIYTTPDFICGTPIDLTLLVTDFAPGFQMATNTLRLRSGFVGLTPALYNNNTPANIPNYTTNGLESVINVAGQSGAIGKVTVSLYVPHTAVGDLTIDLISPDGTVARLSKNQGGFGANFGAGCAPISSRTTFDDNAANPVSGGAAPFVGPFRPDESLEIFVGKSGAAVNGAWRLRIIDTGVFDAGTLQCWTLALHPTTCTDGGGPCLADVAVSASAAPLPALRNQSLTYSLVVTNHRPLIATGVVVTNVLPAGVTFVSATNSQGACTLVSGAVRCNFGTLSNGTVATATIVVTPTVVGSLTNVFTAGAATQDANLSNNTATVVLNVIDATPSLIADGALLVADATGGIEAGETVTVNLALKNVGSAATVNLVAALLEGSGVTAASAAQNYGVTAIGASTARAFTFTASGSVGDTITATLQLQDGVQNLGTATFHFTIGGEVNFANVAPIVINQVGPASPYPSTISVSGLGGSISKARVTFTKLSHTFPDDIDALLVGPLGQKLILMSDAGGGNAIVNKTLTFDSAAAASLPNESVISSGIFLPTDFNSGTEPGGDVFPSPAPTGPLASSFLAFNSTDPNGVWSLYIHDDGGNDGGSIAGGWTLGLTTVFPINPIADLQVTSVVSPLPVAIDEPFTITLTVFNNGPSNASAVVLTDVLPASLTSVTPSSSQGTVSVAAGVLTANLGSISSGAAATVTIQLTVNSTVPQTNTASVAFMGSDFSLANNTNKVVILAVPPVSDLSLFVTATPEPVFVSSNLTFTAVVTNFGPNHAALVRLTNRLDVGFGFLSATSSQGACSFNGGVITCDLGDMAAHGSATVTVRATALTPGVVTNLFAVTSVFGDAVPSNNTARVTSTIKALSPFVVPAGVALISESILPANSAIESGESVIVNFGLRNVGTADAANLVATLQSGGGVSSPSGAQTYGAMTVNGPTVAKAFSFNASGAPGSTLTATLQLQDGAQDLGTAVFTFSISANRTFTNGGVIIIPDHGPATNYPATLTVSGVTGTVSKVTVTIKQLTHTFPEDIDMLLVGPAGQKVLLMSDAGAGNAVSGLTFTLDDAAGALPFANVITGGTYHPTDYPPGDTFPAPAPAGPYGTNLSAFNGADANGVWSLYVFDDANGDAGRIDGGWSLNIQTAAPITASADVAVSASAPSSIPPGATFTNVITVANYGPAVATGVSLNDTLPAGFTLGSVSVSQGSYSTGPGTVSANLGTLNVGASATVTIVGSGAINMTNFASVAAASPSDPNLANNSTTSVILTVVPGLNIRVTGTNVIVSWPAPSTGYLLESSSSVLGPWLPVGAPITVVSGQNQVTIPATGSAFYRLRKP